MRIKSNMKRTGPSFLESAWLGFLEILPEMGKGMKILTVLIAFLSAYFIWDYSGILALFTVVFGFILVVQDDYNGIDVPARVTFTVIALLGAMALGSTNVYFIDDVEKKVKYSKIKFTDSTEKMVVYMTHPIKKTIVFTLPDSDYYDLKDQANKIKIKFIEKGEYDHWSKLSGPKERTIEEYTYEVVITAGDSKVTKPSWKKSPTKLYELKSSLKKEK